MREVRRCWAWVHDVPMTLRVMENGSYRLGAIDDEIDPATVTEIPPAEWLRANEADFRELLDACKTLLDSEPYRRVSSEPLEIIEDIVDRRWKPEPS